MKAFEARNASIKSQFDRIEEKIKQAADDDGSKSLIVQGCTLYPEVAEKLADEEGYDVLVFFKSSDQNSWSKIGWERAEEGVKGKVIYVSDIISVPAGDGDTEYDIDANFGCSPECDTTQNPFLQAFVHGLNGLRPEVGFLIPKYDKNAGE